MIHPLHQKAVNLATNLKKIESDLVIVIQEIDSLKLFRKMGYPSLYEYVNRALGLSESTSYALISVSRKSTQVPELKMAIENGNLSISQAKRITSVITTTNAPELIVKAQTLTQKQLEREVAKINPQGIPKERSRYLTGDILELKISIKEKIMEKLKRVQDLESQRNSKSCIIEETLEALVDFYIEKKDPLKKSEKVLHKLSLRRVNDKETAEHQKGARIPIPAATRHLVNQRDQGKCCYKDTKGRRCQNRRWLETHHRARVSQGGNNKLENLLTLCRAHHHALHESQVT